MNKIDVLSDTTWQSQLTTVIASHKTGVVIVLRCQFYLLKTNDLNLSQNAWKGKMKSILTFIRCREFEYLSRKKVSYDPHIVFTWPNTGTVVD